ncbi:MAG: methionyl-tRNA formyltransferase [Bosea sp. (in: a-proteobacteria)]
MSLRVIFMGTPDFAVPTLTEILGQGHEVVAVYTREPARSGRGLDLRPSPVHKAAERFGIPVLTPKSLRNEEATQTFQAFEADVAVVVAYGMILPLPILEAPELGCLNLHGSLLPRWRGAAPLQRAIMAGEAESGVCVMQMEAGLDTGPVGMVEKIAIGPDMTTGELHDALATLGADLMVRALAALSRGGLQFQPQPEAGVTYAAKITNEECRLGFDLSAQEFHNRVRGLSPFPGAFVEIDLGRGPERLKILRSSRQSGSGAPGTVLDTDATLACADGAIRLEQVQPAGGKPMSGADFLRGQRLSVGAKL